MRLTFLNIVIAFGLTLLTLGSMAHAEENILQNHHSAPVYLRIFKQENVLELWQKSGRTYTLYKSYKICKWSGKLGPKQLEGDKQSPEGFYSLTSGQLGWYAHKWRKSFNIGFPNNFDLAHKRTGTNLLIHGGCHSIGCYAMTTKVMHEIYDFIARKVENGQQTVPLHIFPFKMHNKNMVRHAKSPWYSFWQSLKPAYDLFEKNRTPPAIQVCSGKYQIKAHKSSSRFISLLASNNQRLQLNQGSNYRLTLFKPKFTNIPTAFSKKCSSVQAQWVAKRAARHLLPRRSPDVFTPNPRRNELAYNGRRLRPRVRRRKRSFAIRCNMKRPSCRRWVALKSKRVRKKHARTRRHTGRKRTARAKRKYRYRTLRKKRVASKRRRRR